MRSSLAYTPRPGPLQAASPGAAVAYLGALLVACFLYSNPVVLASVGISAAIAGRLAGARAAVDTALRIGAGLALVIALLNPLVTNRGETVLARLGDWPLLGQVDVTAEALTAGLLLGLRAAVAILVFAVYSACVDPDRVLRSLRPVAHRSALTATLVSRLVPVAAGDAARLGEAARLRGPAAAPVGRAAMARRLLAGSLDRAVDVAATLELRGYGLSRQSKESSRIAFPSYRRGNLMQLRGSRYDRRFYAVGATVLAAAIAGKLLGADAFAEYPTVEVGLPPATLGLSALLILSGLAPYRA